MNSTRAFVRCRSSSPTSAVGALGFPQRLERSGGLGGSPQTLQRGKGKGPVDQRTIDLTSGLLEELVTIFDRTVGGGAHQERLPRVRAQHQPPEDISSPSRAPHRATEANETPQAKARNGRSVSRRCAMVARWRGARRTSFAYSPARGIFVPGRAPPQRATEQTKRLKPRPEMADRFRGAVRWWLGGEEPAERTPVREQAPQPVSRQRAADRKRGAVSGGPSWTRTRSQWIRNAAS